MYTCTLKAAPASKPIAWALIAIRKQMIHIIAKRFSSFGCPDRKYPHKMKMLGPIICKGRSAIIFDAKYDPREYQLFKCSLRKTDVSDGSEINHKKRNVKNNLHKKNNKIVLHDKAVGMLFAKKMKSRKKNKQDMLVNTLAASDPMS